MPCTWQQISFKKELCHVYGKRIDLNKNYVMYMARVQFQKITMSCAWKEFRFKKEIYHVNAKTFDLKKNYALCMTRDLV